VIKGTEDTIAVIQPRWKV